MKQPVLWLVVAIQLLQICSLRAQVMVTEVKVDGRNLPFVLQEGQNARSSEPIQIPINSQEVKFLVKSGDLQPDKPSRIRCKLDGWDTNWVVGYSHMRLVMRVLDKYDHVIAGIESKADFDSRGWQGSVQNSQFTANTLRMVAPPRAAKVQFWCVSGGPGYTTGLFALQNLRVSLAGTNGEAPRKVNFSTDSGTDLDKPSGSLTYWTRGGTRSDMAQIIPIKSPQPHHALLLCDWDSETFATWIVPPDKCAQVNPGEAITAEWEECYCVGQSGTATFAYNHVAPGNYWLRVAVIGMDNTTVLSEESLPILVLAPIWQRPWFWLLCSLGGMALAALAARQAAKKRTQREFERLERRHMLDRERSRIARDIHDDLGTSLTQISLLSQSILQNDLAPEVQAELGHIHSASLGAIQAMDEVVWAADPSNDSLDELATYFSGFAQNLLDTMGIRCRIEMPINMPNWGMSAEARHNVFLAFKEALNNAIKHGQPTEVQILLELGEASFSLSVSDNGKGHTNNQGTGHGFGNMRTRLETIGGRFYVETPPGGGTLVRMEVPIKK